MEREVLGVILALAQVVLQDQDPVSMGPMAGMEDVVRLVVQWVAC